jgi:cysteine desulfurase
MCSISGPPPRKPVPAPLAADQPLPFYLDHNATTPLCDEAWDAMLQARVAWGNASSLHPYGLEAKFFLDAARETVRACLGAASPDCVIFTGSGTEANNIALVGGLARVVKNRAEMMTKKQMAGAEATNLVILSTIYEHPAVEEVLRMLTAAAQSPRDGDTNVTVVRCAVDPATGVVDVAQFRALVEEHAANLAIVTVMHANNELGSINPIAELAQIVRVALERASVPRGCCFFHTDAAQTIGKVPTGFDALGLGAVDMISVCAHKFYGPKGVGALVLRDAGAAYTPGPVIRGAKHERGVRPSTENVIMVSAAAAALKSAVENLSVNAAHARRCRDILYSELRRRLGADERDAAFEIIENGSVAAALPNTLNIAVYHRPSRLFISAARMITSLGRKVAMSSGSACHAAEDGKVIPVSAPLRAVGVGLERAIGTLRLTTGKLNRVEDMPRAAQILAYACKAQMPAE